MTSSNPTTSTMAVDEEALDPVLASIRKVEAIRDFASDITPLRPDGFNLHSWAGEIDKTLSDLIDRELYLRGSPSEPVVKSQDKIARNLIYWTIPRELRSLINDAATARDAYRALQAQFLRNTRTSHMAALVDLFNFQMDVNEPQHITMLYDQMYKAMKELVSSGFIITEDSILGAMFQIALGRANSHLYTATSNFLDTKFANDQQSISSHEVCAAARRELEHWHNTIFDEGPTAAANQMFEAFDTHLEEQVNYVPSVNLPHSSMAPSQNVLPATNAVNQQQPVPSSTVPKQSQPHPVAGSSHTDKDPPVLQPNPSAESSTSSNQAVTHSDPQAHEAVDAKPTIQTCKPSNVNPTGKSNQADLPKASVAASPAVAAPLFGSIFANKTPASNVASSFSQSSTPSSTTNSANLNLFGQSKSNPSSLFAASNKPDRKQG